MNANKCKRRTEKRVKTLARRYAKQIRVAKRKDFRACKKLVDNLIAEAIGYSNYELETDFYSSRFPVETSEELMLYYLSHGFEGDMIVDETQATKKYIAISLSWK